MIHLESDQTSNTNSPNEENTKGWCVGHTLWVEYSHLKQGNEKYAGNVRNIKET